MYIRQRASRDSGKKTYRKQVQFLVLSQAIRLAMDQLIIGSVQVFKPQVGSPYDIYTREYYMSRLLNRFLH